MIRRQHRRRGELRARDVTAAFLAGFCMSLVHASARAETAPEPMAQIIVDSTILRSGPGAQFQRVHRAERGDVFPIRSRATRGGYWLEVGLPDSTSGYVFGEVVHVLEPEEEGEGFLPWLFAPPPLPLANAELSVTLGILGESFGFDGQAAGFMAVRPSVYLSPYFGGELTAAASVGDGGRLLIFTAGGIINLFPDSPVVPYVVMGGGVAVSDANADTFLLRSGDLGVAYGGGGLRFGFQYRITLRIEARAFTFFKPDVFVAQEELSAGLTVFL